MPTTTITNKFLVVVAVVVEMVMVGKMGTDTYSNYNVFSSKVFILPSGSVSGIYLVLMIKVSYVVMVGDHHWRWL